MKKVLVMAVMALVVSTTAMAQIGESQSKRIETTYKTTTTTVAVDRIPPRGYTGMLDLTYGVGVGDVESDRIGFTTVHGYQFNPYLFVGGGFTLNYFLDEETVNLPLFADVRATLPIGASRCVPFFDYRIGYSAGDVSGFYMSPSIGVRFGSRHSFNISIGYEYQSAEIYYSGYYYHYVDTGNAGAVTFRIAWEW